MLVSKSKVAEGDIVAFKIVNGDEIVGKLVSETADAFEIDRPCTVVPSQQGIGLIQSMFTSDPKISISISKTHVIMYAPVIPQMESHYITTTTGIQQVPKGGIIT
jgi:hypothetical protein